MSVSIRQLTADDAAAYRDLRIEAVRDAPYSFERTYEELEAVPVDTWVERLGRGGTFGLFDADQLAGMATLNSEVGPKVFHRGHLNALYVRPTLRGTGASRLLLDAVIGAARARNHLQLYLVVSSRAAAAAKFYQRAGFVIYATDPRGLLSEGEYVDDYLMLLRLD